MNIVYLNGEFVEKSEAKVSVFDRGYLFADGVYEVIPRFNAKFLGFKEHEERLNRSLQEIEMDSLDIKLSEIAEELISKNNIKTENCGLYVQITRGVGSLREHNFNSQKLAPSVFMMFQPVQLKPKNDIAKGYSAITAEDIRWSRCDIKSIALLPNILVKSRAAKQGHTEVIFYKDSKVSEGSASNVFAVHSGTVYTPKKSNQILGGITRDMVIQVCKDEAIDFKEADLSVEDLYGAEEVWITSSTKLVAPITALDGKKIAEGVAGKVWSRVYDKMLSKFT